MKDPLLLVPVARPLNVKKEQKAEERSDKNSEFDTLLKLVKILVKSRD